MASEIKVDTISEKTSAGGVTIDGLLIKDGGISGDVSLIGTTPTFTIGDAGAEDAALVFDGNAQDFYIALDDTADDLVIGLGSTVGTTPAISINSDRDVTISDGAIDFDVASHDTSNGLKLGGTLVTATAAELNIMDGVTSTAAELNIMDGVTSTAAEINLIDGGTARGTTALADGDGVLINDGGTMRMTTVQTVKTYMGGANTPAFLATTSDDQGSLAAGSTTKIEYKDEVFDTDGVYDNSTNYRWTPGVVGKYMVGASGHQSNNDGERAAIRINKNGSSVMQIQHGNMNANGDQIAVAGVMEMDADDYIEGFWFNGSSQSKDLSGGVTICRFWGYRIIT
jgi:hypothetical protein